MLDVALLLKLCLAVKPDATPDEIKAVVNDDQGGQIFAQAVSAWNSRTL